MRLTTSSPRRVASAVVGSVLCNYILLKNLELVGVEGFIARPPVAAVVSSPTSISSAFHSKATPSGDDTVDSATRKRKRVVVVGAGWAGFSAATVLSDETKNSFDVVLLDGAPRGKGGLAGGWRTPNGRVVEAGIHGFWREYRNTFEMMRRIDGVEIESALTDYTPSVMVSKTGRVAVAPVLNEKDVSRGTVGISIGTMPSMTSSLASLLPPPLDLALTSSFSPSSPLTPADRASAVGLLPMWADFAPDEATSWGRYDSYDAEELFLDKAGVTRTLYDELVQPLLHVLPMCPGNDCSAAAALSCFHAFALQSKGAFDVRWCRGSIAETVFDPWTNMLSGRTNDDNKNGGSVEVRGNSKVVGMRRRTGVDDVNTNMNANSNSKYEITLQNNSTLDCDAIVMAVGATSIHNLAKASPTVFGESHVNQKFVDNFDKLRGVTCVAVRLFFSSSSTSSSATLPPPYVEAMKESPVVVCGPGVGNIPELEETGFCLYDLQRLQDEFARGDEVVVEVDFFRADALADLEDDAVIDLTLRAVAAALDVSARLDESLTLVDKSVVRARNAVSHFAVNSASYSPPVRLNDGLYMCGDWVDRTGHASWSTEKAVVTGRQAANALARDFDVDRNRKTDDGVIPVAQDTEQLRLLRAVAQGLRKAVPPKDGGIPLSPWAFLRDRLTTR